MKVSECFPGSWLKAADLGEDDHVVTISDVRSEMVGQGQQAQLKLVLEFEEFPKALVCNKTNATTIAKLYGEETDLWKGEQITLWVNPDVSFGGEQVSAIRVRAKKPMHSTAKAKAEPALLLYRDAVALCAEHGISEKDMKDYLKANGQTSYRAASGTPLVRQLIAGLATPLQEDDDIPF